jgi:anti-anti-sigma factor
MEVQFQEEGERLIARPQGRMDADGGIRFAHDLQQRLHPGTKSVTIDLEGLDFVDLGGVRAILRLGRSLKDDQRNLDFVGGGHAVREALDQAGFHDFFPFTPPYHLHRGHHDETP